MRHTKNSVDYQRFKCNKRAKTLLFLMCAAYAHKSYLWWMIQIDVSQAINTISREFAQRLTPRLLALGISRALNHTAAKAKTGAIREIRRQYNVQAKYVRAAMKQVRARPSFLESRIDVSGRPLPLLAFGARQNKRGVSVAVMAGQRKQVQRAFIRTMPSGHKGVFARGGYQRGQFQFRTQRVKRGGTDTPIAELKTLAVPQALTHTTVINALAAQINRDLPDRIRHEFTRLVAGLGPSSDFDGIA